MRQFRRVTLIILSALPIVSVSYFAKWKLLSSNPNFENEELKERIFSMRYLSTLFSWGLKKRAETHNSSSLTIQEAQEVFRNLSAGASQSTYSEEDFEEAIRGLVVSEKIRVKSNVLVAGNDSGIIPK